MSFVTVRGEDGHWQVWIHMDAGDPTDGNAESFIIGLGETRQDAISDAKVDLLDRFTDLTRMFVTDEVTSGIEK